MGKNNVLYDRNHVGYAKDIGAKKLYIDGSLYPAIIRADYEGRLQIHNAVGACQAEIVQVTAGVLPGNYSIYADNTTSEVVLTWPGTKTISNALTNPGLETGDLTGWTVTPVGGSASLEVNSTHPHGGSKSAYWAGGKGLGSEGGIECYVENNTKGVVTPGQKVSASVWILYNPDGGTPKGSRGQCRLNWYDSNDNKISTSPGYLVKTRKFNGKWTNSIVSDRAPLGTAYARLVSWITATGAGHTYFDDAGWDIPDATGATVDVDITLKIKVTDSIGRVAYWEGTVPVVEFILPTLGTIYGPVSASASAGIAEVDSLGVLHYFPGLLYYTPTTPVTISVFDNKLNKSNGSSFTFGLPKLYYYSSGYIIESDQPNSNIIGGFSADDNYYSVWNGNGGGPFPMINGVFTFPPWLSKTSYGSANSWLYASRYCNLNHCLMTDTSIYYYSGTDNSIHATIKYWSKSSTGTRDILPLNTYVPDIDGTGAPLWFITKDKKVYHLTDSFTVNANYHLHQLDEGLNLSWTSPWAINVNGIGAIAIDGGYLFALTNSGIKVYRLATGDLVMTKPTGFSINPQNGRVKLMVTADRVYIQNNTNLYAIEYKKGVG